MDAPIFPLTSSAMQFNRLSRDFRNQLNKKKLHSINSSPAVLISPGLLSGSSPKHLSRVWLFVLPHLNNGDTGSTLNRSLRSVKRVWGPLLLLRCPQETAPVSAYLKVHLALALGCPPRLRRVSERCPHERGGVLAKRQKECAFSTIEDHLPWRGMGLNVDPGTPVTGTYRVHPVSCEKNKARPVTHCQTVSETVRSYGSSIQRDTFWTAVHETSTVVAQDQRVFPEGQPLSHDQGHAAMLSSLVNVEETLVPLPGSRVESFMSSQDANDRMPLTRAVRPAPRSSGESSPGTGSSTSHCPTVAGQSMVPRFNIPSRRASAGAPR